MINFRSVISENILILSLWILDRIHLFVLLTVSGPGECYECLAPEESLCGKDDDQVCATERDALGTTHCGSGVGKYRDENGNIQQGFWRGCINCDGKSRGGEVLLRIIGGGVPSGSSNGSSRQDLGIHRRNEKDARERDCQVSGYWEKLRKMTQLCKIFCNRKSAKRREPIRR